MLDAVTPLWWLAVGLAIAWLMFRHDARVVTRKGETAFKDHYGEPSNPVHVARFNAFVSRSAASQAVADVCGMAAVAVALRVSRRRVPA